MRLLALKVMAYPAEHQMQLLAPAEEYVPLMHYEQEMSPEPENWPARHCTHELYPGFGQEVPGNQLMQIAAPCKEYFPETHETQVEVEFDPTAAEAVLFFITNNLIIKNIIYSYYICINYIFSNTIMF